MNILMCGDVVGRTGRDAITTLIPKLKTLWSLDVVVVNGENAAHGFGITDEIAQSFYTAGVDVITTGNHIWDQKEIIKSLDQNKRLLRPLNYPATAPGRGMTSFEVSGKRITVINAMGRIFMDPLDDPFAALDRALETHNLGKTDQAILVDMHGEATSEKMAMGHFLDGRVTAVVGTHTHVPTSDLHILPGGTAYQSDLGMVGDYNSVVGMDKTAPLQRFTRKYVTERMAPATGPATLCGVFIETDDKTGHALRVRPVRIGGVLQPTDILKG